MSNPIQPDDYARTINFLTERLSQAERRLAQIEGFFLPKWITPVTIFSHGIGTVNGATASIATATGDDVARIAIISASVGMVVPGASAVVNQLVFRRASVPGPLVAVSTTVAGAGGTTGTWITRQVFVPLEEDESFTYDRTDNTGSSAHFIAVLEGYLT